MPKPKSTKKQSRIPYQQIADRVACPSCYAKPGERCHRYSSAPFGVQDGGECGPHRLRVARYRRLLRAQKITRTKPA